MTDRRVLLTVSGTIPDDLDDHVAQGRRPRADYRVLATRLGADVVDVPAALAATGRVGALIHRVAGVGALLAWFAMRHRAKYDVIVTDGEQVGLPYAALTRLAGRTRPRHVMIVHVLTTRPKQALMRALRLASRVDRYLVYASSQRGAIVEELGVPESRVELIPFMVDTRFFAPDHRAPERNARPLIVSAGLERRDYDTLIEAVDGLDVEVVIAAASPWSTQADGTAGRALPHNVTIERFDLFGLRGLYARADVVVMPLLDVDFQAGITTILEAMAMERAIVCTRTSGQTDTIVDGQTGVYVPVGDAAAMRSAIRRLLGDDARRAALGAAAREWVCAHADIDRYAALVAGSVDAVCAR